MKQKIYLKRCFSFFLVLILLISCSAPASAYASEPDAEQGTCQINANCVGEITITNKEEARLELSGEHPVPNGTMEIFSDGSSYPGIRPPSVTYTVPYSDTFTFSIQTKTGGICFAVDFGDWTISIRGVGIEEVTFDHSGKVTIIGTDQKFCLEDCGKIPGDTYRTIEARGDQGKTTVCAVYQGEYAHLSTGVPGFYFVGRYTNLDDGNGYALDWRNSNEYPIEGYEIKSDRFFTDVPQNAWFWHAAIKARFFGVMRGVSQDRFGPYETLTRAQAAQLFYNLDDKPYQGLAPSTDFQDCKPGMWYVNALSAENRLFEGFVKDKLYPERPITREEFATMLYTYERASQVRENLKRFRDGDKVSPFAQEALSWAVEESLIVGKGAGVLDPQGTLTRAEAAAIMDNYFYWKEKTLPRRETAITRFEKSRARGGFFNRIQ